MTAATQASGRMGRAPRPPLYTPEQRARRDRSPWTRVQGVLAPVQLLVCVTSAVLVLRALRSGDGAALAHASVVVKTALLYAIMVTGAAWERDVYGQALFAPAFFWEDVVSIGVILLHTAYLAGLLSGRAPDGVLLPLALVGYAAYLGNAGQFLWKLRRARRDERDRASATGVRVAA